MENKNDDFIFKKLHVEAIRVLKFSVRNEDGTLTHKDYSIGYMENWANKRINIWLMENNPTKRYTDQEINLLLKLKVKSIDAWVESDYKSKEYISKYNKKYYLKKTKVIKNIGDRKTQLEQLSKNKFDTNYSKVLEAYQNCVKVEIKPTIKKIMKLTNLSVNTTRKYLKIVKEKKKI